MTQSREGLTKTYNRFHSAADRAASVGRLRELQHELDLAVLRAYGWDHLFDRAAPEFLTEEKEPDHRYRNRLFWRVAFRDEVLGRLLDLNNACAAREGPLGPPPGGGDDDDGDRDDVA